jgi:AraC family transcriptional regulator
MSTRALPKSCSCLHPLFRGAFFHVDDWRCAGHDSPGRHEEWCADDRIVITRRGVWQLQHARQIQTADPLHAILWPGQSGFRIHHPIGGADDCTVIRLTERGTRAMRECLAPRDADQIRDTFAHQSVALNQHNFALHWRLLLAARNPQTCDVLAIEDMAQTLLMEICQPKCTRAPPSKHSIRIAHQAKEVIAKRFRDALSLSSIAETLGCSPFYVAHQFKRVFGTSVHQAQIQWRLRVGLSQVLDAPKEIGRIAMDLGFASHSHFSDTFRAQFGCAPNQAQSRFKLKQR